MVDPKYSATAAMADDWIPIEPGTDAALGLALVNVVLREGLGTGFIDYYCRIKEAEIARFNLEVSDWEHREYFDLF